MTHLTTRKHDHGEIVPDVRCQAAPAVSIFRCSPRGSVRMCRVACCARYVALQRCGVRQLQRGHGRTQSHTAALWQTMPTSSLTEASFAQAHVTLAY